MRSLSPVSTAAPESPLRGFTVVELLVVVAIIGLLVAILVVGLEKARFLSQTARCLNNQRTLALAQVSYATDNGGAYASSQTKIWPGFDFDFPLNNACGAFHIVINKGNMTQTAYHGWVASYAPNMTVIAGVEYEAPAALEKGRLFAYIGSPHAYRSPLEPTTDRIRSYSFNGFVGTTIPEDGIDRATAWHTWFCAKGVNPNQWKSTHAAFIKHPSQMLCAIVEDDRRANQLAYNAGGWLFDPRTPAGTPDANPVPATGWQGWIDWPAFWHPEAITHSYMDGSTATYSVQSRILPSQIEGPPGFGYGHGFPEPAIAGFRRDWHYFRERLFPGI
ncbi:MAG: type II secretion system protein, partial [Phycisphaerales bacterium]|nr:type II secretion system protein [Phycisphaerales bacterium]